MPRVWLVHFVLHVQTYSKMIWAPSYFPGSWSSLYKYPSPPSCRHQILAWDHQRYQPPASFVSKIPSKRPMASLQLPMELQFPCHHDPLPLLRKNVWSEWKGRFFCLETFKKLLVAQPKLQSKSTFPSMNEATGYGKSVPSRKVMRS